MTDGQTITKMAVKITTNAERITASGKIIDKLENIIDKTVNRIQIIEKKLIGRPGWLVCIIIALLFKIVGILVTYIVMSK